MKQFNNLTIGVFFWKRFNKKQRLYFQLGLGAVGIYQQKTRLSADFLTDDTLSEYTPGLSRPRLTQDAFFVNPHFKNVEVRGVEPPPPDLRDPVPHRSTPTYFTIARNTIIAQQRV